VVQSAGRIQLPERVSEEVRDSEEGNGHDADVQGPHVSVVSEREAHGRFDGASILYGTTSTGVVPQMPTVHGEDPSPRKGLTPARADTM
jgi:hypothetical protein